MPNPNISAAIPPVDKATLKTNVDANNVIVNVFGVNLTPSQRRAYSKMGPDSESFVQDCLTVGQTYPETVPGDLDILEFEKDVKLFKDLNEIKIHHASYIEKINDTQLAVGSEAYKQGLRIYNGVKEAAKNNSALESVRAQLAERFILNTGSRPRTSLQTLAIGPNSSVSVIHVVDQSAVKNVGDQVIMVCQGVMATCQTGAQLAPGQSMNLPGGVSSITVTNLTGATATFTVKTVSES